MKKDKLPIAKKLGSVKTIEQLTDVIEHVLSIRELVGREFSQTERQAFRWIVEAAYLPSFKDEASKLSWKIQDKFIDQLAELEQELQPTDDEMAMADTADGEQAGGGLFLFDECMN